MSESGAHFRRDVGVLGAVFIIVNSIIGSGIFGFPELLHQAVGTFAPWLVLACSLVIANVAICFAALAKLTDRSGGPQRYVTDAFGHFTGFEAGWLFYVARMLTQAANGAILATYAAAFVPALGDGWGRTAFILVVLGAITFINVIGIRRVVELLGGVTLFKLAPLVALGLVGSFAAGAPGPVELPQVSAIEGVALATLFAFVGVENATIPTGEVRNPRQVMPRAIAIALPIVTLVYFAIQYAYSNSAVAGSNAAAPLAALGSELWGPAGAYLIGLTVIVSVFGNVTAGHTTASRITAAMGEDRLLPGWFGRVSRWGTPANSIIVFGLGATAFALSGTFVFLATAGTLARMLVFMFCVGALPILRRRAGLAPLAGILLLSAPIAFLFSLWAACQSTLQQWQLLGGFVVVGTILFALARRAERDA